MYHKLNMNPSVEFSKMKKIRRKKGKKTWDVLWESHIWQKVIILLYLALVDISRNSL